MVMRYSFFLLITPGHWVIGSTNFETTYLSPNVGNQLSRDAASYSRRTDTSSIQLLKPKNWQDLVLFARSLHPVSLRSVQLVVVCAGLNAKACVSLTYSAGRRFESRVAR